MFNSMPSIPASTPCPAPATTINSRLVSISPAFETADPDRAQSWSLPRLTRIPEYLYRLALICLQILFAPGTISAISAHLGRCSTEPTAPDLDLDADRVLREGDEVGLLP